MSNMTDDIAERVQVFLSESPNWAVPISEPCVTINGLDPDEYYWRRAYGRSHTMHGRLFWPKKIHEQQ